jgi:hypothetical protein
MLAARLHAIRHRGDLSCMMACRNSTAPTGDMVSTRVASATAT